MNEDSDFDKTIKKEREASFRWREKNEKYLNDYLDYLSTIQNWSKSRYELLLIIIGIGFIINLSSSIMLQLMIDTKIIGSNSYLISSIILVCLTIIIIYSYTSYMKRYMPSKRSFIFGVTLDELAQARDKKQWEYILKYIDGKKMLEFKEFGKRFFENLEFYMRNTFDPGKLENKSEELVKDNLFKSDETFVGYRRKYSIINLSTRNIISYFEVSLEPSVTYSYGEGKQTHVKDIFINFTIDVEDNSNPYADDFIKELYWMKLGGLLDDTAICIERAFYPLIDEINPSKIIEEYRD